MKVNGAFPLRRWLLIGLFFLGHVPILVMAAMGFLLLRGPHELQEVVVQEVRNAESQWTDSVWRDAMAAEYGPRGVSLVLLDDGVEIFRNVDDPLLASGRNNRVVVDRIQSTSQPELEFLVFGDPATGPPREVAWMVLAGIVVFMALIILLWGYVGRTIVRPLTAAGDAAREVAAGNLDIVLPGSRIQEVDQLNVAINSMSADLQASLEQQAEMEQDRRLMIGAVVHDLRTPLFSLRGYLAGLESGVADTPEKQGHYFAVAQEKADALERLISDLFDYTRLEYLEETPAHERLELDDLLESLVDGMLPQAGAKGVAMLVQPEPDCLVSGDRHLLTRSIENLLDNALRHTPAGGTITTGCRRVGADVIFTVTDTGPGIPEADLPHLFTPLFRGETSRNRRTGGAGLGLTIARRIIRAHGGELEAGNSPDGGAVFTGRLPA